MSTRKPKARLIRSAGKARRKTVISAAERFARSADYRPPSPEAVARTAVAKSIEDACNRMIDDVTECNDNANENQVRASTIQNLAQMAFDRGERKRDADDTRSPTDREIFRAIADMSGWIDSLGCGPGFESHAGIEDILAEAHKLYPTVDESVAWERRSHLRFGKPTEVAGT